MLLSFVCGMLCNVSSDRVGVGGRRVWVCWPWVTCCERWEGMGVRPLPCYRHTLPPKNLKPSPEVQSISAGWNPTGRDGTGRVREVQKRASRHFLSFQHGLRPRSERALNARPSRAGIYSSTRRCGSAPSISRSGAATQRMPPQLPASKINILDSTDRLRCSRALGADKKRATSSR